jgi:hypothetical protein
MNMVNSFASNFSGDDLKPSALLTREVTTVVSNSLHDDVELHAACFARRALDSHLAIEFALPSA